MGLLLVPTTTTMRASRNLLCLTSRSLRTQAAALAPSQVQLRAQEKIAGIDRTDTFRTVPQLRDSFNRQHDYLRISLTERCNLRCFYCMPSEGIELSPDGKLLTNDEILRVATLFVKSGVTKIRLTGGEPTVRKGIESIIGSLNELRQFGLKSIGMTTNGLALHRRLPRLVENGLTHLNLSLDTLDPFKFELITRRRGHEAVLKSLDAALSLPLASVKVNVVVMKGLNEAEVPEFVEMTKDKPISVRFIEFMPFTGNKWDKKKMVPSSELLELIKQRHPDVRRESDELNDTAKSWAIPGYKGSFGFISSMSDHFCATCNRLRLTADGQIKVCLFDAKEISLRDKLRQGATDEQLLDLIGKAVMGKKEKHGGMSDIQDIDVVTNRPMILIGDHQRSSLPKSQRINAPAGQNHRRHSALWPFLASSPPSTHIRLYSTPSKSGSKLTHLDEHGRASMVDVSAKAPSHRSATAAGRIIIPKVAYELVTASYPSDATETPAFAKARRKGDALTVAQLAAIMGAKQTSTLIPLCHPLALSKIDVKLLPEIHSDSGGSHSASTYSIQCTATVRCEGKTGVEMEALTAVSVGLLTVWDMLKAVAGKEMQITGIMVTHKSGGQSGDFERLALQEK